MKICLFGFYDQDYSRNRILVKGLNQNDIDVVECRSEKLGVCKYFDLIWKFVRLKKDYDLVIALFPAQAMILARLLTRKKIIYDAFISLYDSLVCDRRVVRERSIKAKYYWWLDKIACILSDRVMVDTLCHAEYFCETFGLSKQKFLRVFVGSDANDYAAPVQKRNNKLQVLFYGSFIPLQGVDKVIRAAEILKRRDDIHFTLIGSKIKEHYEKIYPRLNIDYLPNVKYKDLAKFIARADVCLGIFGDTDKADRVIPNKVYDGLALGRIVITKRSGAVNELLEDRKNVLLVGNNPESIVEILDSICQGTIEIEKIKNGALKISQERLAPAKIAASLLSKL